MVVNHTNKPDAANTLQSNAALLRRIEALEEQVFRLTTQLERSKAAETSRRIRETGETTYPSEVVGRIIVDGEPPLKVFREWRGLTQEELAEKAGTSKGYISQIETRHRQPSRKLLYRLAKALDVSPDLLLEEPPEEG